MKIHHVAAACVAAALSYASPALAADKILIIGSDYTGAIVKNAFDSTGLFATVDYLDRAGGNITLADFAGYNGAFVYTNYVPGSGTDWGDVLKSFVDGGGQLTLSTYAFSTPWDIAGGIMTAGYAPFTNTGAHTDISGTITKVANDKVFNGVTLSNVSYFHNGNYADPGLATGAVLLATDGGTGLIARNAAGTVYGFNIYPALNASDDTYRLIANSLTGTPAGVPEPASWAMMLGGFALLGGALRRRRSVTVAIA